MRHAVRAVIKFVLSFINRNQFRSAKILTHAFTISENCIDTECVILSWGGLVLDIARR